MTSHILDRLTSYFKIQGLVHYEVALMDESENLVGFLDESGFHHVHESRAKLILTDAERILASPEADVFFSKGFSLVVVKHVSTHTIIASRVH